MGRALLPILLCVAACRSSAKPHPPVNLAASVTFADARALQREGRADEALEAARRAVELAPEWIAPRRFLDDAARDRLRTPERVSTYRAELAQDPQQVALLYLTGRLEGLAGQERFEVAARLDPRVAWVWHGLAWNARRRGNLGTARRLSARAQALARDPYERAYFAWARSRLESDAGDLAGAMTLLVERLQDPTTDEGDHTWLAAALARLELQSSDTTIRRRGSYRALHLLERNALTPEEIAPLVDGLSVWGGLEPGRQALHLALAGRSGAAARRERGHLFELEDASPLALALLREDAALDPAGYRVLEFAVGEPGRAVLDWVDTLPTFLLDGEGRPLGRTGLVRAAQALGDLDDADPSLLRSFQAELLLAGWFEEAQALASRLPGGDLELALSDDRLARAGSAVLHEIVRLGQAFDRGEVRGAVPVAPDGRPPAQGEPIENLDDLLEAIAELRPRAAPLVEWTRLARSQAQVEARPLDERVVATPRLDYGLAGELTHPGPIFSRLDQEQGLGPEGTAVPGLGQWLRSLGRFGYFGKGFGRKIDGVVLRLVTLEQRRGEHLGVAWSGWVAWCDGTDLAPRVGRGGTRIAGAALHEGYWIDISVLRTEQRRWAQLYRVLAEQAHEILSMPPLVAGPGEPITSTEHLMGAANRLRLALMVERGGPISLDELCLVTAIHEEGHLCDRARYFPLQDHWWSIARLFASVGFSGHRLEELLEERAQLIAMCVVDDPRVPLSEILQAAEEGGGGTTAHGAAYARLCKRFLEELEVALLEDPGAFASLDPAAFLGQQAHHMSREQVRVVALALARRYGLVAQGWQPSAR